MNLFAKSAILFMVVLLLLAIAGTMPSAATLGIGAFLTGGLVIYQTIIILKDESPNLEEELARINDSFDLEDNDDLL